MEIVETDGAAEGGATFAAGVVAAAAGAVEGLATGLELCTGASLDTAADGPGTGVAVAREAGLGNDPGVAG